MPAPHRAPQKLYHQEIRFDRRVQNMAHIKEDGKYPHRTDSAADPRSEAAPPSFPASRHSAGNVPPDQADEQPHCSRGGKLVGRRDAPRQSQKARCPADSPVAEKYASIEEIPASDASEFHQRAVHIKDHRQHAAGTRRAVWLLRRSAHHRENPAGSGSVLPFQAPHRPSSPYSSSIRRVQ